MDNNTPAYLELQLEMMNAKAKHRDFADVAADLLSSSVPPEIVTRLKALWTVGVKVADSVFAVGKIIVVEIAAFLKNHPDFAVSLAVGACAYVLTSTVPILGPVLAPFVALVGVAVASNSAENGLLRGIRIAAENFLAMLLRIFTGLRDKLELSYD